MEKQLTVVSHSAALGFPALNETLFRLPDGLFALLTEFHTGGGLFRFVVDVHNAVPATGEKYECSLVRPDFIATDVLAEALEAVASFSV